jgi:hypothetical protein
MVLESQPEFKSPIPLSNAKDIQRRTSRRESDQPIAISPSALRDMLGEVIDQKVSAKITRLETSINRML